ncbi:MAG TPA: hypothetical protein VGR56_08100 [Nitrososphaerales archaeon]|nr:hypothetical protein [Nitrososphaerales archaeon]
MRRTLVAGLLTVAILIAAGAGYLTGNTSQKTITSTAVSTTTYSGTTFVITSIATTTQTLVMQTNSTGASGVCISNIANPTPSQYVAMLHQIILMPSFIHYSNGRCWTWGSTFEISGPGFSRLNFVFDHFSNTIYYLCGYLPAYELDTRVYVVPSLSRNGSVTGISIQPQSGPFSTSCPQVSLTIQPRSLDVVLWNSSGQTVSLELQFLPFSNASLRSLEARISNSSWSYMITFLQVNSTNLLRPGSNVVQEIFIPGAPLRPNVEYDMAATGTYVNGTQVVSNFKVLLQT